MTGKLLAVALIVTTASLFFDSTEAEAGGRRACNQRHSNYRQTAQHYIYLSDGGSFGNGGYGVQAYAPYTPHATGYGNIRGYSDRGQHGYERLVESASRESGFVRYPAVVGEPMV